MIKLNLTDYDVQAKKFAILPEYSIHCGTDYLALKDVPAKIRQHKTYHKILDLGCGSGLATRYLKQHFPDALIIGADINENMLIQARLADPNGLYLHLPQFDQEIAYPFLSNFFDIIICSFVIHENRTLQDLEKFLYNIVKTLNVGGLFLAWDVHQNLFKGRWLSIKTYNALFPIKEGSTYSVKILPADAEVTGTYWSPETLANILKPYGLCSHISYPVIDEESDIHWLDEKKFAPYFLFEAIKEAKSA